MDVFNRRRDFRFHRLPFHSLAASIVADNGAFRRWERDYTKAQCRLRDLELSSRHFLSAIFPNLGNYREIICCELAQKRKTNNCAGGASVTSLTFSHVVGTVGRHEWRRVCLRQFWIVK